MTENYKLQETVNRIVRECINEMAQQGQSQTQKIYDWNPKLNQKAKDYCNYKTQTIPVCYGYDYLPQSSGQTPNAQQKQVQDFIYCLKRDGNTYSQNQYMQVMSHAATWVCDMLIRCFGNDVHKLTLVPVPTHDNKSNTARWKQLCAAISSRSGIENGYGHFIYTGKTLPSHYNKGNISSEKKGSWENKFFSQKNIILIDDLLATGQSLEQAKAELEKLSANVVMAIVFAKSMNENN